MKSFLCLLIFPLLFVGCASKGTFETDFITKEINPYYKKVDSYSICVKPYDNHISKAPLTFGAHKLDMAVGNVNSQIETKFFEQYFSKVSCNGNADLIIDSTISDYDYSLTGFGGATIYITANIRVYKGQKVILSKDYKISDSDKIISNFFYMSNDPRMHVIELFHKSLLNFYETEFKKDLLDAL